MRFSQVGGPDLKGARNNQPGPASKRANPESQKA